MASINDVAGELVYHAIVTAVLSARQTRDPRLNGSR